MSTKPLKSNSMVAMSRLRSLSTNPDVYKHGEPVLVITGNPDVIETWVQEIAKSAGAKVDWHYSQGFAQVLHLGDEESWVKVQRAIVELEPLFPGTIVKKYERHERGLPRLGIDDAPIQATA